jgi:hypothetical protein
MIVAAIEVDWANGFSFNWTNTPNLRHGIEMSLVLTGVAVSHHEWRQSYCGAKLEDLGN